MSQTTTNTTAAGGAVAVCTYVITALLLIWVMDRMPSVQSGSSCNMAVLWLTVRVGALFAVLFVVRHLLGAQCPALRPYTVDAILIPFALFVLQNDHHTTELLRHASSGNEQQDKTDTTGWWL